MSGRAETRKIKELGEIFSEYHEFGKLVEEIVDPQNNTGIESIEYIREEFGFEFAPDRIGRAVQKMLNEIIEGYQERGQKDQNSGAESALGRYAELGEDEKLEIWMEDVLRIISEYEGNRVYREEGNSKVLSMKISDLLSKIYEETGFSDEMFPRKMIAQELRNEYEIVCDVRWGVQTHKVEFSMCGNDRELLENSGKERLVDQIDIKRLKEEMDEVDNNVLRIAEVREVAIENEWPTYRNFDNHSKTERLKNFLASSMLRSIEQSLGIEINSGPERVNMKIRPDSEIIGITGRNKDGKWIIQFKRGDYDYTLFDLEEINLEEINFRELRSLVDSAPTGFDSRRDDHVPTRAPDVFLVDLIHELGHATANVAADEIYKEKEYNQNTLIQEKIGKQKGEEVANEVAGLTLKGLEGNAGGNMWRHVREGFEAYLELTKYDAENKGYTTQHPILGTRKAVRELFEEGMNSAHLDRRKN